MQILIDMDQKDEEAGRMEEVYQQLHTAYCQSPLTPDVSCSFGCSTRIEGDINPDPENVKPPGLIHPVLARVPVRGISDVIAWFFVLFSFQGRNPAKLIRHGMSPSTVRQIENERSSGT